MRTMEPVLNFVLECLQLDNSPGYIVVKVRETGAVVLDCSAKIDTFFDITIGELLEAWVKKEAMTDRYEWIRLVGNTLYKYRGGTVIDKIKNARNKQVKDLGYEALYLTA